MIVEKITGSECFIYRKKSNIPFWYKKRTANLEALRVPFHRGVLELEAVRVHQGMLQLEALRVRVHPFCHSVL